MKAHIKYYIFANYNYASMSQEVLQFVIEATG